VSVYMEGGCKGVLWILEGRFGRGWRLFADELRLMVTLDVGKSGSEELGTRSALMHFGGADFEGRSKERLFVEVLQLKTRVERKGRSLVCMDLLQMLSAKAGIGGEDARLAVDCSSLEPSVMAVGSVRWRGKKKGKTGICGVLSLLGQIKRKLDWVFVGPTPKPNRRSKWVCVLGLTTSGGGWTPGLEQKSDLGLYSDPGQCLFPGLGSGPGQKTSLGLNLELDLVEASPMVPSKGIFLGSKDGLELATRDVVLLSSVVGVELLSS
jgi:hypothetical protein